MLLLLLATCWAAATASTGSSSSPGDPADAAADTPDLDTFEGMMGVASRVMQERKDFKLVLHTFWAGCPEFDITKNRYTPQKMFVPETKGIAEAADVPPKGERKAPESAATRGSALWKRFGPQGQPADRFRVCNALGATLVHYADGVASKKIHWFVEDFDAEDAEVTNTTFAGDAPRRRHPKKKKKKKIKPSASDKLLVTLRALLLDAGACLDKAQSAMDELVKQPAAELEGPELEEEQRRLQHNLSDLEKLRGALGMDGGGDLVTGGG